MAHNGCAANHLTQICFVKIKNSFLSKAVFFGFGYGELVLVLLRTNCVRTLSVNFRQPLFCKSNREINHLAAGAEYLFPIGWLAFVLWLYKLLFLAHGF